MKPQRPTRPTPNSSPEDDISYDAELWDLLGKADRPTPVSPFFARNVLREVRLAEAQKAERGWSGLLRRWRMVVTGTAVAAAVALAATLSLTTTSSNPERGFTTNASYDAEIIAQLDELLDDESIWLDSTVSAY